jgi:DNA-binding response OmpR family regulator
MSPAAATENIHILVLEDDYSIAELLSWILTEAGYRVTCASSLQEAREAAELDKPDLIIADLLLPDGLGSDLLFEMARSHNGTRPPAIVMSALPQARQQAEAAGAQVCMTKPFDLTELLDAVSRLSDPD